MKKIYLLISIILSVITTYAQSTNKVIIAEGFTKKQKDTAEILSLINKSIAFHSLNTDSSFWYAQKALILSQKKEYAIGVIKSLTELGNCYYILGNYPKAFKSYFEVIKECEKINYERCIGSSYENIANIYLAQDDPKEALIFSLKAKPIFERHPFSDNLIITYNTIGGAYIDLNLDSALYYCDLAYQKATQMHRYQQICGIANYLGQIHEKLGNNALALTYYRLSAKRCLEFQNYGTLSVTYVAMAIFFNKKAESDSSIFYSKKSLIYAQKNQYLRAVQYSSKLLSDLYSHRNNDSTLKYLLINISSRDSLFGVEKQKQMYKLSLLEQKREDEITKANNVKKERSDKNIRLFGISFFIALITLITVTLKLKKANPKVVGFLGVLSLLLLFEFLELLIHSYVEEWTDNNAVIMLLILVVIAWFLGPLHHKLQNWIKTKFSKRTRRITKKSQKTEHSNPDQT